MFCVSSSWFSLLWRFNNAKETQTLSSVEFHSSGVASRAPQCKHIWIIERKGCFLFFFFFFHTPCSFVAASKKLSLRNEKWQSMCNLCECVFVLMHVCRAFCARFRESDGDLNQEEKLESCLSSPLLFYLFLSLSSLTTNQTCCVLTTLVVHRNRSRVSHPHQSFPSRFSDFVWNGRFARRTLWLTKQGNTSESKACSSWAHGMLAFNSNSTYARCVYLED